jgi:lipopolysaccharide export system protein LptC
MDARNLLSLSGVLLVLGAAGYYWGIAHRAAPMASPEEERRPDYVVQTIGSVETDAQGRLLRRLTATELRHYDAPEEVAELDKPVMTFYEKGRAAWRVAAQRGVSRNENTEVRLEGGVQASRLDAELPVTLRSRSLTVFPREERLLTRDTVTIESPRGRIESRGLEASMPRGELKLTENVTGTYAPAPR